MRLLALSLVASYSGLSQTLTITGVVTTPARPVRFASVVFVEERDTTKKYAALTDAVGAYRLSLPSSGNLPTRFELIQNYPNPFSSSTTISYKLNDQSAIAVRIYNILGQKIRELHVGVKPAGIHSISWDGTKESGEKVSAGVYFYEVQSQTGSLVRKMVFHGGPSRGLAPSATGSYSVSSSTIRSVADKSSSPTYRICVANTDSTKPRIGLLNLAGVTLVKDTTINIEVQPDLSDILYVIERDHLSGFRDYDSTSGNVTRPVENFHETFAINASGDTVSFAIESPMPDTVEHESRRSPAFGQFAFIPIEYSSFLDVPNLNSQVLADKPDSSSRNAYIWKNLKLGPGEGIHVPYSSHYGECHMFTKEFGTSRFLNMDITSEYAIARDSLHPTFTNIEIKQTLQNTSSDTIYRIGFLLFVPRRLMTKFDPYTPQYATLYNLVTDTVISPASNRCYLYRQWSQQEGFGFNAIGQEMNPARFDLPPYQAYQFVYRMQIETVLDKFEIYPSYVINMMSRGDRIWPGSIISIGTSRFQGPVGYLRECGLSTPAFIVFTIDHGALKVANPDNIAPTLKPDY